MIKRTLLGLGILGIIIGIAYFGMNTYIFNGPILLWAIFVALILIISWLIGKVILG